MAEFADRRTQRALIRTLDYVTEIGQLERLPPLTWVVPADVPEITGHAVGDQDARKYAFSQWAHVLEEHMHPAGPNDGAVAGWCTAERGTEIRVTLHRDALPTSETVTE
ncbi:hypothetical protein HFP15_40860 [Amycolatopsis sp. K13G38]|uniref:Uncharacterized protein n=1 Tax=Amycolatopsis acididurans TaxID=2724524 RepID=A0ABX1JIK6_9PSEU|nr:hypothetical protein [Amycolatopsis acididurans]NKQ59209.1 hypothetical protein [Amycolatopsis acididurans]